MVTDSSIGASSPHPVRPAIGRTGIAGTAAMLGAMALQAHAGVVTQWRFNDRSMSASTGTGVAQTYRTTHAGYVGGVAQDGTTAANRALRIGGFGTAPGLPRGVSFTADVSAQNSLRVTYWQLNDRSSSRWAQFQYSLDGSSFTSAGLAGGGIYRVTQAGVFRRITFAIPGTGALDGIDQLRFRVVAVAAPGTNAFAGTLGAYRPVGNWRFDLVSVTGTPNPTTDASTPAPGAIALLGLGGAVAPSRRRWR